MSHATGREPADIVVTRCDPPIPNLGVLVQQLNEDRNIMGFIKRGQLAG